MHSQFYDKFNIRYNISQILKCVWSDLTHRQKVIGLSKDLDFFVKFVNLLMNDTTFLLDEGLTKLTEIKNIEVELAGEEWAGQSDEYKTEKNTQLSQAERSAQSYIQLVSNYLEIITLDILPIGK